MPRDVDIGGEIIRDVPDDVPDWQIAREMIAKGRPIQAGDSAESFLSDTAQGFIRGVGDLAVGVSDVTGGGLGRFSDAEAARIEQLRAQQSEPPPGGVGGFIGGAIPNLATMRLKRLVPTAAGEGAIEFLRAPGGSEAPESLRDYVEQGVRRGVSGAAGAAFGAGGQLAGGLVGSAIDWAARRMQQVRASRQLQEAATAAGQGREGTLSATLTPELENPREQLMSYGDRMLRIQRESDSLMDAAQQGTPTARRLELVREMDRLNFPLSPGQRTGSAARRQAEAGFSSNPMTAQPFADLAEEQATRTAELLARGIGAPPGTQALTPEVLDNAMLRIGGEFQEVAGELGSDVFSDTAAFTRFMNSLEGARNVEMRDIRFMNQEITKGADDAVGGLLATPTINNMIAQAGFGTSGAELMSWRSALVDEIQQLSSGRVAGGRGSSIMALSDSIDAIDDLIVETAGDTLGGKYADTRSQYRLLSSILKNSRGVDQLGEVKAGSIASVLSREYPREYRRGNLSGYDPSRSEQAQSVADAFDAVRGLSTIAPEIVPNSGTANRMFFQQFGNQSPTGMLQLAAKASVGSSLAETMLQRRPALGPGLPEAMRLSRRLGAATGGAVGGEGGTDLVNALMQMRDDDDEARADPQ